MLNMLHKRITRFRNGSNKKSSHFNIFLLFATFFVSTLYAQDSSSKASVDCVISFKESMNLSFLNSSHFENVSWTIAGIDDVEFSKKGSGAELKNITFDVPGEYIIGINELIVASDTHSDGCSHAQFPQEIHLTVLPYNVSFNFDGITFSNPIHGNKELQGTLLTVPVKVESYNNKPVDVSSFHLVSAGVGTTITGTLVNGSSALSPGDYLFIYALKGSAQKDTYIMFDFFFAGQTSRTYYFPTKIN
jgi:hypothetical protein